MLALFSRASVPCRRGLRSRRRRRFVGAIAQRDHMLDLIAGAGARNHERADRRLVDHVVHDVGKCSPRAKAVTSAGFAAQPKSLRMPLMPSRAARSVPAGRARLAQHVGGQRADAAGVGDDGDAGLLRLAEFASKLRHFEQLIVVLHADHAVLLEHRFIQRVGAGQRGACASVRRARPMRSVRS